MNELKAYPEYKDSGVQFLGRIPAHWSAIPASAVCKVLVSNVDKKSYPGEKRVRLCNYTDVYYNEIIGDEPGYMVGTATREQIAKFTPRVGDVAITKDSESSNDIGISAYVPMDLPGVVFGYHLAIYRTVDPSFGWFLKYLFDSAYAKAVFETKTPGVTRVGLSQNTLKYFRIPSPPREEIQTIANFIKLQASAVDNFISDQVKLIELLKERRSATITQAVTKGLDPDVPLKDSGLAWLPRICQHWTVIKMQHHSRLIQTGPFGSQIHSEEYIDGAVPLINPQHLIEGRVKPSPTTTVSNEKARELRRHSLYLGDIVVARRGELGRSAVVTSKLGAALCGTGSILVRLGPTIEPKFFQMLLSSAAVRSELSQLSVGSTMENINAGSISSLRLPMPPREEQRLIVSFIERTTFEIDAAIADAQQAIVLSKERRAALISAAVTGKIDVRDAVVRDREFAEAHAQ